MLIIERRVLPPQRNFVTICFMSNKKIDRRYEEEKDVLQNILQKYIKSFILVFVHTSTMLKNTNKSTAPERFFLTF